LSSTASAGRVRARRQEAHAATGVPDVLCSQLRVLGEPIRDDGLGDRRDDVANVGIVDAKHRGAVERQPLREVDECVLELREIVLVRLHVVGVDVGDHRQHRLQDQKRCIGFVGFGDQELALAKPRVGIRGDQPATDDEGGIESALRQDAGDETGGRRLAMGSRDGDSLLEPHQFGQHQGARHHRDVSFPRRRDLGIVGSHRGRHDNHIGAGNVVGCVARGNAGAQCSERRVTAVAACPSR
jgi:hypothetical protein